MTELIPSAIAPDDISDEALLLVFYKSRVLIKKTEQGVEFPLYGQAQSLGLEHNEPHYLGRWRNKASFVAYLSSIPDTIPGQFFFCDLRQLVMDHDESLFVLAGTGRQILEWDRNHRFCGRCGEATIAHPKDRAKLCPKCGFTQYPRISPCVIVLVTNGRNVLLARSPHFPQGMFSTIAGFVEPGETLEHAVQREVEEEVGVSIENVHYVGSQQWPFPHSLMVGFHAQYHSGDIVPDQDEIEEAAWWSIDDLPMIPPKGSISRHLIDSYVNALKT